VRRAGGGRAVLRCGRGGGGDSAVRGTEVIGEEERVRAIVMVSSPTPTPTGVAAHGVGEEDGCGELFDVRDLEDRVVENRRAGKALTAASVENEGMVGDSDRSMSNLVWDELD